MLHAENQDRLYLIAPSEEPVLDWATLRMNRFFYRFGFACLAVALLVSWISTRV